MYLVTHKCVSCDKQLPREEVIIQSRYKKVNGDDVICYVCNPCNTKRIGRYRSTDKGRKKVYESVYRSIKRNKNKQNARCLLRYHIKQGNIERPSICSVCNVNTKVEGHHEDYSKPLNVVWCCRDCHRLLDRNN